MSRAETQEDWPEGHAPFSMRWFGPLAEASGTLLGSLQRLAEHGVLQTPAEHYLARTYLATAVTALLASLLVLLLDVAEALGVLGWRLAPSWKVALQLAVPLLVFAALVAYPHARDRLRQNMDADPPVFEW